MKIAKNINRILLTALTCVLFTSVGYADTSTSQSKITGCIPAGEACTPSTADFGRGNCCTNHHCDQQTKKCTAE